MGNTTPEMREYRFPVSAFPEIHSNIAYLDSEVQLQLSLVAPKLFELNATLWTLKVVTFNNLKWAAQVILGRGFSDTNPFLATHYGGLNKLLQETRAQQYEDYEGTTDWLHLIPIFEFLNFPQYERQRHCVWCGRAYEDPDGGRFRCRARCAFEEGEEVTLDYGEGFSLDYLSFHCFYNDLNDDSSDACIVANICWTGCLTEGDLWGYSERWEEQGWVLKASDAETAWTERPRSKLRGSRGE